MHYFGSFANGFIISSSGLKNHHHRGPPHLRVVLATVGLGREGPKEKGWWLVVFEVVMVIWKLGLRV
ncbi:hypothetical protein LguiA_005135 [Lonicera macranthoides]